MSRRRFRPRFHSVWSRPLCNCFLKKINQGTDVLTHNCLPPLLALCVLKHVCTRLIILTSNHKIKIDVASWQSAFTPSTANTFFIISEHADRIDCLYGERGCVKTWGQSLLLLLYTLCQSICLWIFIIFFVLYFKIFNPLFSICQIFASFFSLPIHP